MVLDSITQKQKQNRNIKMHFFNYACAILFSFGTQIVTSSSQFKSISMFTTKKKRNNIDSIYLKFMKITQLAATTMSTTTTTNKNKTAKRCAIKKEMKKQIVIFKRHTSDQKNRQKRVDRAT